MKRCLSCLCLVLAALIPWTLPVARADGLIILHDPTLPWPTPPPPLPGPRPPRPPQPPPRPRPLPPPVPRLSPMEVTFHHVDVRIRDQVAVTRVDQEFYNPNDRQVEGTYIFPIPKGAQLDQFSMDVNGKQVEAELLPADKARQIYEDIVRSLRDPALLEYAGRDAFKVRIFPIEPRSKKHVKLSYTQVLAADAGLVGYLYPLNTEKFSARPIPSVAVKIDLETKRPLKTVYCASHPAEVRRQGETRALLGFEARDVKPDTDFQVFFATDRADVGLNLMTYRAERGDGYFLLFAAPAFEAKREHILPKDVAFVLDTSGSMAGGKLEQARKALQFCVENLNAGDRFEIIRFSTDQEPLFNGLVEADRAQRDRAAAFLKGLRPIGGTAIHDALQKALSLRPASGERPYAIIFLTDGLPTVGTLSTDAIVAGVTQNAGATRVFCFGLGNDVNTHLLDRITEATRAYSQYVLPEEDLELKLSNFFTKINEPVLANLQLSFPDGLRVTQLYPAALPDLFKGEQLILAGRYAGPSQGRVRLAGTVGKATRQFDAEVVFAERATEYDFIPRLWATRRIGFLLDEIRLRGEHAELRDEVTELARQYGIVTPYTAYLIHEDETRRGVPLAMQSIPMFATNTAVSLQGRAAWSSFTQDKGGVGGLAAARYGLTQRQASRATDALTAGTAEANRALAATPMGLSSPAGALPAPASVPPMASAVPTRAAPAARSRGAGTSVTTAPSAASAVTPTPMPVVTAPVDFAQQTRFVGGRSFFQNGDQWIDVQVQRMPQARRVRVQFGSAEYFALAKDQPQTRPWLALGANVQFAIGEAVYEVYE